MKDQKEIQIAFEMWNVINKLNDLLWDQYGEEFLEIHFEEEDDKFLRAIEHSASSGAHDKPQD